MLLLYDCYNTFLCVKFFLIEYLLHSCYTWHGFTFALLLGEMRNDLYITIERGEFEKGGKSVARNVEVTMFIVESSGQILKVR